MSQKAGALLWNRMQITVPTAGGHVFDTGLTQLNRGFANSSVNEPPLGVISASPGPADNTLPASRVMVIPQPPYVRWANITHGEPYVDATTGRVNVTFANSDSQVVLNVLFWDPHTAVGPGRADTYHANDDR